MTLFRGLADDLPLMEWLEAYIFPAEADHVDEEFVRWGTRLACLEMLRGGITTFVDMYYFEDAIAEEAEACGMRAVVGETLIDFPAPDNKSWDEAIAYMESFLERWSGHELVTPAVAPHAPYTVSAEHLQQALVLVQKLDPTGVGARDLRECLLLQMCQFSDDMSFEIRMVQQCWNALLVNHLPEISKKMGCSLEQVNRAIERMSKLDTSPGLLVGHYENHPITADVIVEPNEEDGYTVSLIDTRLPNLRVNDFYQKMTRNRDIDDKTRQFLQKNIHSAQWFMDAIQQRKRTLLRVARAIVKYQKGFFDKGKLHLRPLPMSVIADEVGIHLATVSRAVSGKYVQCPQGIFPLRGFFSGGMEDETGTEHSWNSIKAKLQEIVDNEDKSKPFSDDALRKQLTEAGMGTIARRTVAKYRKILDIPTARFRKRY